MSKSHEPKLDSAEWCETDLFSGMPAPQSDTSSGHHSRKRIYIAGPMSGIENFNHPAFFAAETRLRASGWDVVNPARHTPATLPPYDLTDDQLEYRGYLITGLRTLATCDSIYLLKGWEGSKGALAERAFAFAAGISFHHEEKDKARSTRAQSSQRPTTAPTFSKGGPQ